MKYFSLFSGVGGGDLAFQHLLDGFRCVGYVEIEDYCQRVIRQRITDGLLDEAPIFGDIRTFISEGYARRYQGVVDLVTGGFPCQDISCAGKGAGIEGERSGLWSEMAEVVRQVRPRYVFVENSPMLIVRGLGTILKDLAEMGFDAKWGCISASSIGAIHRRERLWIMGKGADPKMCSSYSERKVQDWKKTNFTDVSLGTWGKVEPPICGMDYDLAHRVDRLKAIGNGQVSLVAATAWEILNGK